MTKTPEEIMAAAVVTARESCGLSRSELGRAIEAAGGHRSSAWRMDTRGRVAADELTGLIAILNARREDLARKAASAQSAIDALSKINPTLVTEPDEPEPPTEPEPKPTPRKKASPKPTPAPRRSRKAATT